MDKAFEKFQIPLGIYNLVKSLPLKIFDLIPSHLLRNENTLHMIYEDLEFDYKNPKH